MWDFDGYIGKAQDGELRVEALHPAVAGRHQATVRVGDIPHRRRLRRR